MNLFWIIFAARSTELNLEFPWQHLFSSKNLEEQMETVTSVQPYELTLLSKAASKAKRRQNNFYRSTENSGNEQKTILEVNSMNFTERPPN